MWVCQKCYQENADQEAVCRGCGTQRSAGRFQAQARRPATRPAQIAPQIPPQIAPQIPLQIAPQIPLQPVIAPAAPHSEPVAPQKPRGEAYAPPPFEPIRIKRSPTERFAVAAGAMLLFLAPLLVAAFAWRQNETLRSALLPLLLDEDAGNAVGWIVYAALALIAALLSALPGLWTLLAARRPAPRGIRHAAARK